MAQLVILEGPEAGRAFPLKGERTVIGRDPDVDVSLPSKMVSRRHAQITAANGAYLVEDLGSRNGTFLNGERVRTRVPLTGHDRVKVGEFVLELSQPAAANLCDTALFVRDQVSASSSNQNLYALNAAQKLQVVLEIAQEVGTCLDVTELLDNFLRQLLRLFPKADRGLALVCEQEHLAVRAQRCRRDGDADFPFSRTIVRQALDEGVGLLSEDVHADARFSAAASLKDAAVRSILCVPLIAKDGRRLGVIQLDRSMSDDPFRGEELRLLTTLCLQAAVVLDNVELQAERLREELTRKELAMARDIQQGFLPGPLAPEAQHGFELFAHVEPARQVSGDFYDYFTLANGRLAFFVGDAAGKGVPAALFLAAVRTLGRHLAAAGDSPAQTLARLNDAVAADNSSSMFVTLVYGIYDPRTGDAVLTTAGHPAPLLRRADGRVEAVTVPGGRVLGCLPGNMKLVDTRLTLAAGETLIYFTDGLTEAFAPDGTTMFGVEGLKTVLGEPSAGLPLEACAERVAAALRQFTATAELQDDQTLLMLRRV